VSTYLHAREVFVYRRSVGEGNGPGGRENRCKGREVGPQTGNSGTRGVEVNREEKTTTEGMMTKRRGNGRKLNLQIGKVTKNFGNTGGGVTIRGGSRGISGITKKKKNGKRILQKKAGLLADCNEESSASFKNPLPGTVKKTFKNVGEKPPEPFAQRNIKAKAVKKPIEHTRRKGRFKKKIENLRNALPVKSAIP